MGRPVHVAWWAAVAAAVAVRLPTLGQPLVEAHAFRQTQTAYTALEYHRHGIDLLQTPLPVLGPPWVVPFEFPLFQGLAAVVMNIGVPADIAMRSASLVLFIVAAGLLWLLIDRELDRRTANAVAFVFLVAPIGLLWSRSSTIETMALALTIGTVLATLEWEHTRRRRYLSLAVALAILAGLVKVTTAFVWLVPAVFLVRRSRVAAFAVAGTAGVAGALWTIWTDAIKGAAPATADLTNANPLFRGWTLGTLAERLDPVTWITIGGWALASLGLLGLLGPRAVLSSRVGRWAAATFVLGPVALPNLYFAHDYYWMASLPAAAILAVVGITNVGRMRDRVPRMTLRLAAIGLVAAAFAVNPRWARMFQPFDEAGTLRLANEIAAQTRPTDLVAIRGRDWSPAVLYYADRRGLMLWWPDATSPAGYVVFQCPAEGQSGDCQVDEVPNSAKKDSG